MEKDNVVKNKSYQFSLDIIALYKYLTNEKNEYVLSKQLLRSGTSIGANVEEAIASQSKKEFIAKLNISLKEAHESHYWLRLLKDSNYMQKSDLIEKVDELIKIITSIIISTKENLK
jgi:four helix bundle protein